MRQAILITAYNDFDQLRRLVAYFDDGFEVFVHIDKRCRQIPDDVQRPNVHLYQRYRIPWGSVNHLRAIVFLMGEAAGHGDLEYFHLITGSDYPVPSLNDLKSFGEAHRHENYLEYFPLPRPGWDGDGGLDRVNYYWPQRWLRPGENQAGYRMTAFLVKLQRKLGLRRWFDFFDGRLYGGGTYWSVSREAVEYALGFLQAHPRYLRRFRNTKIAEEICLPTLWANSELPLTNHSLRYIEWGSEASPRVLDEQDFDRIVGSGCLFARKISSTLSKGLVDKIKHYHGN